MNQSRLLAWLLVLALATPCLTTAQPTGSATAAFTPEQLEQVAAPIALYPDPLLAQVMMAVTCPLEIVQAAWVVRDHKDLKRDGSDLVSRGLYLDNPPWSYHVFKITTP